MTDYASYKELGSIIGTVLVAAVGSVLGFRKIFKNWEKDGVEISKANAEGSLINSLREESERMAKQNATLMKQLNELQLQILDLHQSISSLKSENEQLKVEIQSLQTEITRLKNINK